MVVPISDCHDLLPKVVDVLRLESLVFSLPVNDLSLMPVQSHEVNKIPTDNLTAKG